MDTLLDDNIVNWAISGVSSRDVGNPYIVYGTSVNTYSVYDLLK